ncbi:hypothetical protein Acsp06_40820 [Actinomycetospora sp. NBRC 106375]|uniref:hypothetical protein n=1 Tax=Actinomycetospora sp. NBRC 106375 TaxID=3032207 RepID=UPI0024A4D585|nr:hypothetical protein [Actinomycetospora sp. NBRC 106375]GLZ47897.1 hypothetical protein Acsp06_40820 [Actinomycetospora sp. NBRC 106375]
MGAHSARQTSTVGKVAGRGALTAAAALALTGGTASFAFAAEAPNVDNTTSTLSDVAQENAAALQDLPDTDVPTTVKGGEELVGGHVSAGQHQVNRITSAATSDLQTAANANGIPVGSHATDTEQKISGAANRVAGQVHDATGAGAHQVDDAIASHGSSLMSFGHSSDSDD